MGKSNFETPSAMIVNNVTKVKDPINLENWISNNITKLIKLKSLTLLQGMETSVTIETGPFNIKKLIDYGEAWIYQIRGNCNIYFTNEQRAVVLLKTGDCLLVEKDKVFELNRSEKSIGIVITMRCHNKSNPI